MLNLSAARINMQSPYTVLETKEGDFVFHSKNGVDYDICFMEEAPIGNCPTYQLSIANINNAHGSHDPLIKKTIMAIIEEFFNANDNVLLYICDDADGREAKRNRLFIAWFNEYASTELYTIRTASAVVEEKGFYTAIIVKNSNPLLDSIVSDFEEVASHLSK